MTRDIRKPFAMASAAVLTALAVLAPVAVSAQPAAPQQTPPAAEFDDTFCGYLDMPYDVARTDAACWMRERGIATGYDNGTRFGPNELTTRGQFITMMWRAAGSPSAPNKVFRDEAQMNTTVRQATDWAWQKRITTTETFNPRQAITRDQVAALMWRAAGRPAAPNKVFRDEARMKGDVLRATDWLWHKGYAQADPYNPKSFTPRSHAAMFLWRQAGQPKPVGMAPADAMTLWFDTTRSPGRTVAITLGNGDATINWGDGNTRQVTTAGRVSHTYAKEGYYMATIIGQTDAFGERLTVLPGAEKLVAVSNFGNLGIEDLDWSFPGAVNLARMTRNLPAQVDTLEGAFGNPLLVDPFRARVLSPYVASLQEFSPETAAKVAAVQMGVADPATLQSVASLQRVGNLNNTNPYKAQFSGDVSEWDVSQVDDFSYMFIGDETFNGDVSGWDTSNAIWMRSMFQSATAFNQDLSGWDTSNVVDMANMFSNATSFNGDVSTWDVGSVVNMDRMFSQASAFNQDLSGWDTSSVTNMGGMFGRASAFNGDISTWDVSSVTSMENMFAGAESFNQDLSGWDTSSVTNMERMFRAAQSFNGDISGWDVSNVKDMEDMFQGAIAFNGDVSTWDVGSATNMQEMFSVALSFNGDISGWDVSNVRNMGAMFSGANAFNGDISGWDVSNVTNMQGMFLQTFAFNQDLSGWDVSNVTNMKEMFVLATAFNQDLSGWDVSNVVEARTFTFETPQWELPKPNFLVDTSVGWPWNGLPFSE